MAWTEQFTCDICGAERKKANHWFAAGKQGPRFAFTKWDDRWYAEHYDELEAAEKLWHLCGQVCAVKLLNQFLSGELK